MNADEYSDGVAHFMQDLFKSQLAIATLHPNPPRDPDPPIGCDPEFIISCRNAITILIVAFTNISTYVLRKDTTWPFTR